MAIENRASGRNFETDERSGISAQSVGEAFSRISTSQTFSGSDRLIGFLEYVVEEEIADRGALVRAKTIAMDFYGYDSTEIEKRESVVRVDAGRLRRKLDEYYSHEGAGESLRFQLPKGQYRPVFEIAEADVNLDTEVHQVGRATRRSSMIWSVAGIVILLVFSGFVYFGSEWGRSTTTVTVSASADEQRKVLFDTSPERLQAINLAKQGRGIIFPATDMKRLIAAQLIFESVVNLDPAYSGGYAGLAQVSGLMAVIVADPVQSAAMRDAAKLNSEKALSLQPDSAWAISAHAWTKFASGSYDKALMWSRRARELAPDDLNILEFDALISLYSGEFREVVDITSKLVGRSQKRAPFVFQNARSAAFFHQGNYRQAIEGFEEAIASGAPLGPITVAYLMAGHHFLGEDQQASELAQKYIQSWPDQRVDMLSDKLFRDPEDAAKLLKGMEGAGWSPNQNNSAVNSE